MSYNEWVSTPRGYNDCGCISDWGAWYDDSCVSYKPFICSRSDEKEYEYAAFDDRKLYQDARQACRSWGGDLASIANQNEQN
jgi:hypothetical protein